MTRIKAVVINKRNPNSKIWHFESKRPRFRACSTECKYQFPLLTYRENWEQKFERTLFEMPQRVFWLFAMYNVRSNREPKFISRKWLRKQWTSTCMVFWMVFIATKVAAEMSQGVMTSNKNYPCTMMLVNRNHDMGPVFHQELIPKFFSCSSLGQPWNSAVTHRTFSRWGQHHIPGAHDYNGAI